MGSTTSNLFRSSEYMRVWGPFSYFALPPSIVHVIKNSPPTFKQVPVNNSVVLCLLYGKGALLFCRFALRSSVLATKRN